jgi:hypothetical protein
VSDEIGALAMKAIHESAELLGVDPYRLARFLGDGAIADLISSTAAGDAPNERLESLAQELQSFLALERTRIRAALGTDG